MSKITPEDIRCWEWQRTQPMISYLERVHREEAVPQPLEFAWMSLMLLRCRNRYERAYKENQ